MRRSVRQSDSNPSLPPVSQHVELTRRLARDKWQVDESQEIACLSGVQNVDLMRYIQYRDTVTCPFFELGLQRV